MQYAQHPEFKVGDRVTCESRPGVLGTVKLGVREGVNGPAVCVEWAANGRHAIDYHHPSHLTTWRPA